MSRKAAKNKAAAEDAQARKDSKKAQEERASSAATPAKDKEARDAAEERLAEEAIAEAEAVVRQREKFNAGLRQNVMGQFTITMTNAEYEDVLRYLAEKRQEKSDKRMGARAGKKRYLVNSNPGPVRIGGRTYSVPAGRHEITPAFLEEYFPEVVTTDQLSGGAYSSRFQVETDDDVEARKAAKPGKAAKGIGAASPKVGHGRQPANDLSTSVHPEATHLQEADRKNFNAGNGVR